MSQVGGLQHEGLAEAAIEGFADCGAMRKKAESGKSA